MNNRYTVTRNDCFWEVRTPSGRRARSYNRLTLPDA